MPQRSATPHTDLGPHLDAVVARLDGRQVRQNDPIHFVHRYTDRLDQEIAGIFAVGLAYGRVQLFWPVLEALFDHLDAHGGPLAFCRDHTLARGALLHPLTYRWNRGIDLDVLAAAIGRALRHHETIEDLFLMGDTTRARLVTGVAELRAHALSELAERDVKVTQWSEVSRGLKYLLCSPESGSACKRWNLYLRWMVRPPTEAVDLGLWTRWHPRDLIMPVDVHVGRIATLLGLLPKADNRWKTAETLTEALRPFAPDDPVRFDFAIAHLGISSSCRGQRVAEICPSCPLTTVCRAT